MQKEAQFVRSRDTLRHERERTAREDREKERRRIAQHEGGRERD